LEILVDDQTNRTLICGLTIEMVIMPLEAAIMSQVLTVELSDHVFEAIRADASASGITPAEAAASALEKQFSNGRQANLPKSLTVGELTAFWRTLPKLGDDADDFARDVEALRKSLPPEKNQWD
jgi:hypothetical protein